MNTIPKAIQSAKKNLLYDLNKLNLKPNQSQLDEIAKMLNTCNQRGLDIQNQLKTHETLNLTCGGESDEFIYTTQRISEEKEFKYVEDDGHSSNEPSYAPPANNLYGVDSFDEPIELRGDQEDDNFNHKLQSLLEENARILEINNVQRGQIERLQMENASVKEVNSSLVSKSEVNTQYLSRTIEVLQHKISELNTRLETHQVNTIEKEKSIQQLIDIIQDIPKQLHGVLSLGRPSIVNHEPNVVDKYPTAHKDPMLKINYKLTNDSQSIKVLCRVKPDEDNCLNVPSSDTIYLPPFKHFDRGMGYRLNKVFGAESSQADIFDEIGPILPSCFSGCNVCLITYGQSGSGKTHTMIGSEDQPGIMLLSMKELIHIKNETTDTSYRFHLTILEIYNENIYDLMGGLMDKNTTNLKTRVFIQDNGHSVQVKDVSEAEINKEIEFIYYINNSLKRRSNSITAKNISSSRSHYLVMIRVSGITKSIGIETNRGSLIMCDLAGSENCNALSDVSQQQQRESKFINKSITMLNRVFDAMYRKLPAIPFRDSKLTHLLKPSLMGNAKCIFIATVSGCFDNVHDTYRTLNVAKKVEMIHYNQELNE